MSIDYSDLFRQDEPEHARREHTSERLSDIIAQYEGIDLRSASITAAVLSAVIRQAREHPEYTADDLDAILSLVCAKLSIRASVEEACEHFGGEG
ncbi:hypothetical protein HD597_006772 [Nonomuraea thailandensis]|uniref:Uncharacterized protein n=1 Tax=Nonomuraea thailandensis TaxID=1188745 RepID=A0A9X2K3R9_9ACTN|nr:hypothetical protein [Nonomuraea thailandensis]MCP2359752.1 hypothetical protein [Nonomuraea thailandensis]